MTDLRVVDIEADASSASAVDDAVTEEASRISALVQTFERKTTPEKNCAYAEVIK